MEDSDSYEALKILIIGESGAGKTSLMFQFTKKEFFEGILTTVGVGFETKSMNIDGKKLKVHFWDTADADGAILVYDVLKRVSFDKLQSWVDELETKCNNLNLVKMVVGNKIDQPNRQVSKEEGLTFACKHRMMFGETSACTNENVSDVFDQLIKEVVKVRSNQNRIRDESVVRLPQLDWEEKTSFFDKTKAFFTCNC